MALRAGRAGHTNVLAMSDHGHYTIKAPPPALQVPPFALSAAMMVVLPRNNLAVRRSTPFSTAILVNYPTII